MGVIVSSSLLLQLALAAGPQDPKAKENAVVTEKAAKFETAVVELPAKTLVGMKVRTCMEKAGEDCGALWQAFAPRMGEVRKEPKGAYGVSVMANESEFDYWAAVEVEGTPGGAMPEGMGEVGILKGTYVRCKVPSMERLSEAYAYLYTEWLRGQVEYEVDPEAGSFEHMPGDWVMGKPFDIYMPIKAK